MAWGLDQLVGDPQASPHPVVVMGWGINRLRRLTQNWGWHDPWRLRVAGTLITLLIVGGATGFGWLVERLLLSAGTPLFQLLGAALLVLGLASALAARSLQQAVQRVLTALPDLAEARRRLSWIVGRDTAGLDEAQILRALAETSSENGIDGLFAPLFWMLIGALLWSLGFTAAPGPLALAWGFKAASTLDSMLGYRQGDLQWLGTAGARLDDALVWLPCRLTALSLPLAIGRPQQCGPLLRAALRDGQPDPSPNAGVSQAAYAHLVGVELGGLNRYGGQLRSKPRLAAGCPPPDRAAVERMLAFNRRLSLLWIVTSGLIATGMIVTKALS